MTEPIRFSDDIFTDEPTVEPTHHLFLGVIGSRTDATQQKLVEEVINPILQDLGKPPEKLLLPEEGISSIYLSDWGESLKIPTQVYQADWHRHQRRAKLFRDLRIQEESTHFLIFLNKRSNSNETLAHRLARKGRTVYTVTYSTWDIEKLTGQCQEDPREQSPRIPHASRAGPAKRGRKPGTGTTPASRQSQPSGGPGIQSQLTDLWAT